MRSVIILLAACGLGLGGCQSLNGYPDPVVPPKEAMTQAQRYFGPAVEAQYDQAVGAERQQMRNRIVYAYINAADIRFDSFEQALSRDQKVLAVGGDAATLLLAGAATVAKSSRTKTRLAAWSTATLGIQGSIDRELFYNKTLPVLIAQMRAARRTSLANLYVGLSKPDDQYPLLLAKGDIRAYEDAGTLAGALAGIAQDTGVKGQAADTKIKSVVEATYSYTDLGQKVRRFWKPDGTINAANAAKLNTWLATNAGGISVSELIYGVGTPAQLDAVIKDLNIQ